MSAWRHLPVMPAMSTTELDGPLVLSGRPLPSASLKRCASEQDACAAAKFVICEHVGAHRRGRQCSIT
jgi:hypothetical protein